MTISTLLIVLLLVLLVAGLPAAPWGGYHRYGYVPSGLIGLLLVVLVVLLLLGRL